MTAIPTTVARPVVLAAGALALSLPALAVVQVDVTVQSLVPAQGSSFDAFDLGGVAGEAIVSVAEGGAGGAWQAALAAADPQATRGTVGGLLQPGQGAQLRFTVDPLLSPYFSFAGMVVPSNDFFIGNDPPTAYRLFDGAGQLQIHSIVQTAGQIWDAGSEVFDPAADAFVGNNGLRSPRGSVVAFNFAELAAFNGLTTATGYVFQSGLNAGSETYRIQFNVTPVPEPGTYGLTSAGLLGVAWLARRRRVAPA